MRCLAAVAGWTGASIVLDIEDIEKLVEMMVANDLVEVSLRDGEREVNLRRSNGVVVGAPPGVSMPQSDMLPSPASASAGKTAASSAATEVDDDAGLVEITSPMVGTFYAASAPDSPPFVSVGAQVHSGMVVCILEAMKVFNEIKSEVSGKIERILAKNAEPVEFGQPLFLVRPN